MREEYDKFYDDFSSEPEPKEQEAPFTKSLFDDYVDKKTGEVQVNKLGNQISIVIWGLVLAKARASFHLTDLVDPTLMKKKYKQIFWLSFLLVFA